MSKIQYVLIALAAAVVILAAGSIYTVNQGEQALVLQFGRPVRVVKEPGLKLKIPMIQNVVFYDARLLNLDPPAQEVVLNDKKRLDVDSFTRYRIIDPLKFYKTGGNRQFLHPQDPRPQHLTGTVVAEAHPDHERHQRRG